MSVWQAGESYSASLVRTAHDGDLQLSLYDSNGDLVATETVSGILPAQPVVIEQVSTGQDGGSVTIAVDNVQVHDSALTAAGACDYFTSKVWVDSRS